MLIIRRDKRKIKILKQDLAIKFEIEDLGLIKYFIGVRITQDKRKGIISLCQDAYIDKVLKRFGIENCHLVDILMAARANKFIVPFNRKAT